MKKMHLYMFLSLAAILAVLAACGEGEIVSASEDLDLDAPGKFVDKCIADKTYDKERCSLFEKAPSSNSNGGGGGGGGTNPSSTSGGGGGGGNGGGIDTPITDGKVPGPDDLEALGGIVYLTGKIQSNAKTLRCNSTGNDYVAVKYCDYTNGECEPTKSCGSDQGSNNIACALNDITFTEPPEGLPPHTQCDHGAYCTYKVKIKFTKLGNTYPSNCRIAN